MRPNLPARAMFDNLNCTRPSRTRNPPRTPTRQPARMSQPPSQQTRASFKHLRSTVPLPLAWQSVKVDPGQGGELAGKGKSFTNKAPARGSQPHGQMQLLLWGGGVRQGQHQETCKDGYPHLWMGCSRTSLHLPGLQWLWLTGALKGLNHVPRRMIYTNVFIYTYVFHTYPLHAGLAIPY